MRCSGWAGGNDPPSPGGRVCPRGGASRPAGPSLQSLLVQFIHLLFPGFPNANRPARQGARAGRRGLAPCEAPDWLRASRAASGTSRAAMFATEAIASFLPQARLRHPGAPRAAANGVRPHLGPGAMGTRAPRDTPRLCRGRIAGEVEELGHGTLTSLSFRSRRTCARRFRKPKIAPPMSLPSCAMRCIVGSPPAATAGSEPG
jgi:hypothetical protein